MTTAALYLRVRVADVSLGLPVARVKEIFEPLVTTRVPGAPKAFRGVVNLRGAVIPVVDLGVALGLRTSPAALARCVVLLETDVAGEPTAVGLACDQVEEVAEMAPDELGTTPAFGTQVPAQQLIGLAQSKGTFVLLLDVERALAHVAIRAASRVAAANRSAGNTAAHD